MWWNELWWWWWRSWAQECKRQKKKKKKKKKTHNLLWIQWWDSHTHMKKKRGQPHSNKSLSIQTCRIRPWVVVAHTWYPHVKCLVTEFFSLTHTHNFLNFNFLVFFFGFLAQEEEEEEDGTWLDRLCKRFDSKLSLYTYLLTYVHTCGGSANRNPCVWWWCNRAEQVLSHTRRRRRRRRINHPRRIITTRNNFVLQIEKVSATWVSQNH